MIALVAPVASRNYSNQICVHHQLSKQRDYSDIPGMHSRQHGPLATCKQMHNRLISMHQTHLNNKAVLGHTCMPWAGQL
jgi:hypothetical protein